MKLFVPGSENDVPRDIEERLKQIDPDFFIKRIKTRAVDSGAEEAWGESARSQLVEQLAVCLKWDQSDPRWQRVRAGAYPEANAFDLLALLPPDITYDQTPGFLENVLRRNRGAHKIMEEVVKWNEDQKLRNGAATFEYGQEVIDRVNQARKMGKNTAAIPDPQAE